MTRSLLALLGGLAVATAGVTAGEIKGTVKKVEDNTITVTVDKKDQSLTFTKDVKVTSQSGKGNKTKLQEVEGGVKGIKEGTTVTLTTETKDGKEVVTQVKMEPAEKMKKDK
jgi:phosphotransferase system HPr-like phosphotransfer protein